MRSSCTTQQLETSAPATKLKVLVVDDDAATRLIAQFHLEKFGYEVTLAEDGEHALAELERNQPALILMDVQMPKKDGFTACKEINEKPELKHIPVVMASSLYSEQDITKAFSHGAHDYIEKPVNFNVFALRAKGLIKQCQVQNDERSDWDSGDFENAFDYVFMLNETGHLINPDSLHQLPFYLKTQLTSLSPQQSLCKQLHPTFSTEFHALLKDRNKRISKKFEMEFGNSCNPLRFEIRFIKLSTHRIALAVNDASMHQRKELELKKLAHHDPDSALPNQLALVSHLRKLEKTPDFDRSRLGIVCIEIAGLQALEVSFGETCATMSVKHTASTIAAITTDSPNTLLARSQADRLDIVVYSVDKKAFDCYLQKLEAALLKISENCQHSNVQSFKVGAAHGSSHSCPAVQLWHTSQLSLSCAQPGQLMSVCDEKMKQSVSRRTRLAQYLKRDLAQEKLSVVFQAKYDIHGECLAGFEVLSRWHCAELGEISPAEFVPLCLEFGLSNKLATFVIEKTLKQMHEWMKEGLKPVPVSINLDAVNLATRQVAQYLLKRMQAYQIAPKFIEIEVTESLMVEPYSLAQTILQWLREKGCRIALDDFGTQYSNLTLLHTLPLDTLKIDRSFTQNAVNDEASRAIINMIIKMGHELHLQVIAEGVENQEQLLTLQQLGCDLIQGYWYSKPEPAHAAKTFLVS